MDLQEIAARRQTVLEQAGAILAQSEISGEDHQKAKDLLDEGKKLFERAEQMKEVKALGEQLATDMASAKAAQKQAGPEASKSFPSWESFLEAVWHAQHKNNMIQRADPRLVWFDEKHEVKDMAEGVGATGGFLVPPEFRAQIYGVMGEGAIVRPRASIVRMNARQVTFPVVNQTGTTAAQPHWFGGLLVYHAEEAAEKTESDVSWRQFTLTANKIIGYTRASDELVSDSAISLGDFLAGPFGFAGAFTWQEDYDFLQGTGVGMAQGILTAPATITVARQSVATPVQYTDLINMLVKFLPTGRGVWCISQSVLAYLLGMSGPTGSASYLWGSAVNGVPNTLLGMPVQITEKLPAAGTAGDVLLADWRYYIIGDRQAWTVETTQYDRWKYDQTSWRAVHRVDGRPWLSTYLTLQDGSTTISPFVILGAKST
ncbi:MAG: phage major capsid protein [Parcubacteria group bacterium]